MEEAPERKIRAFVALKTPATWDRHLADLQERLKTRLRTRAVRWTNPEQLHVTLRFLGGITPAEAEETSLKLGEIARRIPPFTLRCESLGGFPSLRRPRVLWAGLVPASETLLKLHREVTEKTARLGEPPEKRDFKPHLTLGRVQHLEPSNARLLETESGFRIEEPWEIREVLLMRSHLSPHGARYETIGSFPLAG